MKRKKAGIFLPEYNKLIMHILCCKVVIFLEALQSPLLDILGPVIGLLIVGVIILVLGTIFTEGPRWLQLAVVAIILLFFSYAIIDGIINYNDNPIYADEYPADGNGGRYD
jgi:uncharacterized membrane protein